MLNNLSLFNLDNETLIIVGVVAFIFFTNNDFFIGEGLDNLLLIVLLIIIFVSND